MPVYSKIEQLDDRFNDVVGVDDEAPKVILTWVVVTLLVLLICSCLGQPVACGDDPRCQELLDTAPFMMNAGALVGVGTILAHETVVVAMRYTIAKPLTSFIPKVMDAFTPGVLVCCTMGMLILENGDLVLGGNAYLIHADAVTSRPIATVTQLEWLINVPILIILAGRYALGRHLKEVSGALLVTNVYIVLAWSAAFFTNLYVRWTLVGISFIMYFWATWEMTRWSLTFMKASTQATYSPRLRPALAIGLNISFFVYGMVYLAAILDLISYFTERILYTLMNVVVKMGFSMAFAGIRSSAHHEMLVELLVNTEIPFSRQAISTRHIPDPMPGPPMTTSSAMVQLPGPGSFPGEETRRTPV